MIMSIHVAVLGGGVAGLSAAHELIEHGFQVSVYEAKNVFGGKARSLSVPGTGAGGRRDLPGEHGFRFFPAFYRHLPDAMMRIPFPGNVSVFNNLVNATRIEDGRRFTQSNASPANSAVFLSESLDGRWKGCSRKLSLNTERETATTMSALTFDPAVNGHHTINAVGRAIRSTFPSVPT